MKKITFEKVSSVIVGGLFTSSAVATFIWLKELFYSDEGKDVSCKGRTP